MTNFRCLMLTSLLGSVALVGGCSALAGTGCLKPPRAAETQDNPPLRVPVGLDGPDTREALAIPALDVSAVPPFATRCMEDPPQLAPLAAPVADKEDEAIKKDKAKRRQQGRIGPHFR
jgi:uncharacterized lipoprotein